MVQGKPTKKFQQCFTLNLLTKFYLHDRSSEGSGMITLIDKSMYKTTSLVELGTILLATKNDVHMPSYIHFRRQLIRSNIQIKKHNVLKLPFLTSHRINTHILDLLNQWSKRKRKSMSITMFPELTNQVSLNSDHDPKCDALRRFPLLFLNQWIYIQEKKTKLD